MMRKGILLALLATFTFMGGTIGLVYYRFSNLPHPKEASHNQLMYWMILRDLNRYDAEVHLALVNRFSEEAKQIFRESGSGDAQLSDTQNKRLLSNIEILKKVSRSTYSTAEKKFVTDRKCIYSLTMTYFLG